MSLTIIYPALTLGSLGLIFGILLSYASKKFQIELDPRITNIRGILPGVNCGGCGFAGCDAYARAVVEEGASPNDCTAGGSAVAKAIGEVLGIKVEAKAKKVAFVKCNGSCSNIKLKGAYERAADCTEAYNLIGEESTGCKYGCFGLGSCYSACKFDAIIVEDGVARVDEDKCISCGACIKACPRNLIESIPADKKVRVQCNSKDIGKVVRQNCNVGCISCKICEKNCEYGAITISDNLAKVNYEKCTQCKVCSTKCPTKAVRYIQ